MPAKRKSASSKYSSYTPYGKKAKAGNGRYAKKPTMRTKTAGKYSYKGFGYNPRPVQNRQYETLTTVANGRITGDGTIIGGALMNLNSAFNPFNAIAGQPLGWDQLTPGLYDRYKVWSGHYSLKLIPLSATNPRKLTIVTWIARSATEPATLREALSQPGAKSRIFQVDDTTSPFHFQEPIIVSGNWNLRDWFPDIKVPFTTYNASPSSGSNEVLFLNYFITQTDGTVLEDTYPACDLYLTCVQKTEMVRRITDQIQVS